MHTPPGQRVVTHSCPECRAAVRCDIENGKSTCWCFSVKPQQRETEWGGECMCARCLTGKPTSTGLTGALHGDP